MIDDSPDMKWSTPWWGRLIFGIVLPPILALCAVVSFVLKSSFAVGFLRRKICFVPVDGFQAELMAIGYLGLALSLFAYGYARFDARLSAWHEYLLAIGLIIALIGLGWGNLMFYTG
jgi:hypothetical protein